MIGHVLFFMLVLATIFISLAPWQQSVKGTGDVIAYSPMEREQIIETPIKGQIVRLGDGIVENGHVHEGDLIAEVADIDRGYFLRLENQLSASRRQLEGSHALLDANNRNLDAAKTIVTSYESQVLAYKGVKQQVVAAADADVAAANEKITAEKQQLAEQEAAFDQIKADFERQTVLHNEKIVSELKFQDAERKFKEAGAKVEKAKAYVRAAENELKSKQSDRNAKEQKAQAEVDYAIALLRKASADVAKSESEVAKAETDIAKVEKEILEMETKVARQQSQKIYAPFDGFITRISANQSSQVLKEGDPICVIVPDTEDRAVQVWLDGNDAPLVEPGRHVRLQFEGWPAVQFAGWPSVAVGTFGGEVVSVDATDNDAGQFRVLVLPDKMDIDWPNERYLRQGVRANGWVLLEQVPLWYEIWRNMNGFPPVISAKEPTKSDKPPKLPKL